MNKEEKEVVEKTKEFIKHKLPYITTYYIVSPKINEIGEHKEYNFENIQILLNLIQKQEAIIDKMAEQFYSLYKNVEIVRDSFDLPFGKFFKSEKEIIEYFKKEVEKDVKD